MTTVKKLKWEDKDGWSLGWVTRRKGAGFVFVNSLYQIDFCPGDEIGPSYLKRDKWSVTSNFPGQTNLGYSFSLEDAKKKAQKHFEKFIEQCIDRHLR